MTYYQRHLPHWHPNDAWLFITWRLAGTLPRSATKEWLSPGKVFLAEERALERDPTGPLWLNDPVIAKTIADAIQVGATGKGFYKLQSWVVMPNHVHVLILPLIAVPKITRWLKGSTARAANEILNRTGAPFWQSESYDHWVRNEKEFAKIARYIEENPISAGLANSAEEWPWSSVGQAIRLSGSQE